MNIALMVYLASVIGTVSAVLAIIGVSTVVGYFICRFAAFCDDKTAPRDKWLWIGLFTILMSCLIPGPTTTKIMLVAYAGEEIARTDKASEVGGKAYEALNKLLDDYLTENDDE